MQSPGFASYFINGKSVTEDKFISPVSNYSKILWYNSYDVTDLLKEGQHCFAVIAGNGFLNEPFKTPWSYDESPWRDAPQFMLSLELTVR